MFVTLLRLDVPTRNVHVRADTAGRVVLRRRQKIPEGLAQQFDLLNVGQIMAVHDRESATFAACGIPHILHAQLAHARAVERSS